MAKIHVLSADLANQIAAGEVVERPASAVKELVENALDAGATRVEVEIEGGGITRICVSDDGQGMGSEDAQLCLQRHATSKIRALSDLETVASYGFRGEALPSIASVSRFQVITRSRDEDAGTRVLLEGGGDASTTPTGRPVGTTVEVRDLFFNVPARRKFLRSSGTESGHVTEVFDCAALANPEVTFILTRDGRKLREYLRSPSREERAAQVLGEDNLAHCRGERGPLRLEAFLSRPERARSGAAGLKLLVNGRPVKDRALAVTVAQAYGSVLERGRYPRGVVYLELPPQLVDVNVHPQKAEIRFADTRAAMDATYSILTKALSTAFSIPEASRARWGSGGRGKRHEPAVPPTTAVVEPAQRETQTSDAYQAKSDPWGLAARVAAAEAPPTTFVRDSAASPIRPAPEMQWASLRFVAQVRQTYLICEAEDGLYVLDQHAAAERVAFDRLRKAYRDRSVASQSLLFPLTIEVTAAEADFVIEHADAMLGVGLDLRPRGPETVSIHAVPRLLQRASPERLVRDLLSEMMRTGGRGFSDAVDLTLATMACHGSIRAGDVISAEEAKSLLRSLDEADFAGHCPHGRPVVTAMSWAELDRKVGRR
ncbi:MAG TPA: DNA mismatch repair endonuclease MutL [Polyangiaceae bacterium]|nr:DNA mismatch repair endonuclease MutL [Polyangiaceae bacterium]